MNNTYLSSETRGKDSVSLKEVFDQFLLIQSDNEQPLLFAV